VTRSGSNVTSLSLLRPQQIDLGNPLQYPSPQFCGASCVTGPRMLCSLGLSSPSRGHGLAAVRIMHEDPSHQVKSRSFTYQSLHKPHGTFLGDAGPHCLCRFALRSHYLGRPIKPLSGSTPVLLISSRLEAAVRPRAQAISVLAPPLKRGHSPQQNIPKGIHFC